MTAPAVYDHVRPTTATDAYQDGVYRVVGRSDESVTMLRVADADGRRRSTGELLAVGDDEFADFEPAENPDGNRPLWASVGSTLEMLYWSVHAFGHELGVHPLPAAITATVVVIGFVGGSIGALPDVVEGGLIIGGALGLAYVGSGRLSG